MKRKPVIVTLKELIKKKNIIVWVSVIYFLSITAILIYHKSWLLIDQFIFFAYILLLILGKSKGFLKDWLPFMVLLLSYEYLRGIVPFFWKKIYVTPLIKADIILWGKLPTIYLQNIFFIHGKVMWYDFLAAFIYIAHFITPLIIGLIFWLDNRRLFRRYTLALLVLSYAAFITYFLYPAMPPWLAANNKYIPAVHKILVDVFRTLGPQWKLNTLYEGINPNENAAMPSLHAAYPWLIFLFLLKQYGKKSLLFLIYTLAVWISLVYLGEHYTIDIIVGIIYASVIYIILNLFFSREDRIQRGITKPLSKVWDQVPVNYYENGISNNLGQRWWHGKKKDVSSLMFKQIRKKPRYILDIGCADGYLTNWISQQWPTAKVTAIDVVQKLVKAGKKKYPQVNFRQSDCHRLPFKQNRFDLVTFYETLEHVKNPHQVVGEIYRVLKKNGTLIVELDSNNILFRTIWFFWTKLGAGRVWHDSHINPFNRQKLINILVDHGFKISKVNTYSLGMAIMVLAIKK